MNTYKRIYAEAKPIIAGAGYYALTVMDLTQQKIIFNTDVISAEHALKIEAAINSHQLLLDALKDSLQILEQTKIHRIIANVTGGNIFLDATIEQVKQAIINAEK